MLKSDEFPANTIYCVDGSLHLKQFNGISLTVKGELP